MGQASRTVIIQNKKGLHARAAAKFVKCAQAHDATIWVQPDPASSAADAEPEQKVNALSILGLMMLGAGIGTRLQLEAEGAQAEQALDALETLINQRFDEGE